MAVLFVTFMVHFSLKWDQSWRIESGNTEANFEENIKSYIREEEAKDKEEDKEEEIVRSDRVFVNEKCLPEHLFGKVERIKIGNDWTDVVDIKYLVVDKKNDVQTKNKN